MAEPDITMKNTKAEILDALNSALERAEMAEKRRLNPEKQERERTAKKAIDSAKQAVEQNVFSKELIDKFNDLQAAIGVEENRLQELYGVEREVQKLALAIEAGRERIAEIEAEKAGKEKAAKEGLENLVAEFNAKKAEIQLEHDTYQKKLKVERTRESEEYQYNLTRTREKENNEWADQKAAREAELQAREAKASQMLDEAMEKAEYIRSLEEKVEGISDMLAAERDAAIASTTEVMEKDFAHKSAIAEMEKASAVARLEDKAEFLQKELDNSNKMVTSLQGKLDKAYSEMRDLAAKTVEATGGVKILGGADSNIG